MSGPYSGYHDCPCPDCFEIAIGTVEGTDTPAMCSACDEAGCDGISTCEAWEPDDDDEE